ncbi:hypothetical protein GCK72_017337 [Caenorhabditis remanei]|uniref:Uncharacterized protein n=1 Tax=Caenorhabditis remanei TaxID=31234 RepID=A0A6A5G7G0_CAERE|nr:hypothetical protein GCK72_017337 [Caenorhabditis remanei]KAF1750786.1 hypothetical protein GCK72_017337 [Caenorhabditis remanei]
MSRSDRVKAKVLTQQEAARHMVSATCKHRRKNDVGRTTNIFILNLNSRGAIEMPEAFFKGGGIFDEVQFATLLKNTPNVGNGDETDEKDVDETDEKDGEETEQVGEDQVEAAEVQKEEDSNEKMSTGEANVNEDETEQVGEDVGEATEGRKKEVTNDGEVVVVPDNAVQDDVENARSSDQDESFDFHFTEDIKLAESVENLSLGNGQNDASTDDSYTTAPESEAPEEAVSVPVVDQSADSSASLASIPDIVDLGEDNEFLDESFYTPTEEEELPVSAPNSPIFSQMLNSFDMDNTLTVFEKANREMRALKEEEVLNLLEFAQKRLNEEENLIKVANKIVAVGDLHGDYTVMELNFTTTKLQTSFQQVCSSSA